MTTFSQLPGTLDISFVQGDEVNIALDFDREIFGYQLEAKIYVSQVYAAGGGGSSFVTTVGNIAATFTVSFISFDYGQVVISLNETQTSALSPGIGYRWYLRWVDGSLVTRTVLSGAVTVVNP